MCARVRACVGVYAGVAYLTLGSAAPAGGSLGEADAIYTGEYARDFAAGAVAGTGDVNADGYDDLLIGAYDNPDAGNGAGAAYLVLGSATPASGWEIVSQEYWPTAQWLPMQCSPIRSIRWLSTGSKGSAARCRSILPE